MGLLREMGAEEVEFCLRLRRHTGLRIVFCDKMKILHRVTEGRLTSKYIAQRAFWIGRTRRMLKHLVGGSDAAKLAVEENLLMRSLRYTFAKTLPRAIILKKGDTKALRVEALALSFLILGYTMQSFRIWEK